MRLLISSAKASLNHIVQQSEFARKKHAVCSETDVKKCAWSSYGKLVDN